MTQGIDAVRRICEGWNEMTVEEWRTICTPDVAYQNMPWDRTIVTGPDAIHHTLEGFAGAWDVRMEVRQLSGDDAVVFSERVEHFAPKQSADAGEPGEKAPFALPVTGVFELSDGRISAWRDYFDRRAMKS